MKLSEILRDVEEGSLFGRFGCYLSGSATDRSKGQPMVHIKHKVLCADDLLEVSEWLFVKFDPILHTPMFRRMTPVFVEITGIRGLKDGRSALKGLVHLVEKDCRVVVTLETERQNPVPG